MYDTSDTAGAVYKPADSISALRTKVEILKKWTGYPSHFIVP